MKITGLKLSCRGFQPDRPTQNFSFGMILYPPDHHFQMSRQHLIVRIEEHHIRSVCKFQAGIARGCSSRLRAIRHNGIHIFVTPAPLLCHTAASIGRGIIHYNEPDTTGILRSNRIESAHKQPFPVENRNNHSNQLI